MDHTKLKICAQLHAPATEDEIRAVENDFGFKFPVTYVELLRCSNGLEPFTEGYSISLFAAHELAEMNVAYQVRDYLPTLLLIGLDGGGRGIFLPQAEHPAGVFETGMGALFTDCLRQIAPDLQTWIDSGFDMNDPPGIKHTEKIDIFLAKMPAGGLKTLLRIRQELKLEIPIPELRNVLARIPIRLLSGVGYFPYSIKCDRLNVGDDCLEFREAE